MTFKFISIIGIISNNLFMIWILFGGVIFYIVVIPNEYILIFFTATRVAEI